MLPCADSVRGTSDCTPVSQLERTRGLHCSLSWLRTILSVLRACELTSLLNSPPFFFSSRDPDKYPSFNEGSENGSDFDSEGERTSAGAHRVNKPPYVLLAADSPSLASLVFSWFPPRFNWDAVESSSCCWPLLACSGVTRGRSWHLFFSRFFSSSFPLFFIAFFPLPFFPRHRRRIY